MHRTFIRPGFDFLQLFADGGSGGEGSGTGAGAAAEAAAGQTDAALAQPQSKGAKNPLANVQYGREADPAAAVQEEAQDREAKFDALIKGEYKDLYEGRLKDTISKRLKGTEETVTRFNQLSPVLDLLASKYGVDANDIEALSKAIEDDESFYEDEALEKGLTVQQVKEIRKMQRENKALKEQMEQRRSKEEADRTLAAWTEEAKQIKEIYPSFDMDTELKNPKMQRLLLNGFSMMDAFKALHSDEIIGGAMHYTAGQIAKKVANNIAAGKNRPSEGAIGGKSAVTVKRDVSQLTKADRQEIIRRAQRGALIGFN